MLGIAMGSIGTGQKVGLLGTCGHAGGGAAPLDIDDHKRNLGEIRQTDELGHERYARARGGSERTRAIPARARDDADRCNFVFGLHDRVIGFASCCVVTEFLAVGLEGFGDR